MDQLGLQLLQPGFGLLALAQIADESGEKAILARFHFADRQLHRKRRAVLALADDDAADPDDPPLSRSSDSVRDSRRAAHDTATA